MDYKITKENKLKAWRLMFLTILAYVIIVGYFMFTPARWFMLIGLTIFMFFTSLGPGLYLYIEYMKYNKDSILSLDVLHKNLQYRKANNELIISEFNKIAKIDVYIPPNNYTNKGSFTSMEDYSYARFELKDGREFYITCLMIHRLKLKDFVTEYFSEVSINFHHWWVFPSIWLVNYCRRKKK